MLCTRQKYQYLLSPSHRHWGIASIIWLTGVGVEKSKLHHVISRACCDYCYREDNLVTTMIAKLLAYWNGSMVQSCIDLVYTIGKIEIKARTFLTKEVVEEILGINLDNQIVETTVDVHVSDWPNPYGFRQSHILFPLAYNEWTKQSLGCICWTAELQ